MKNRKDSLTFIGTAVVLSVFVAGAMIAMFVAWKGNATVAFYIILTATMTVAAGVNMGLILRRISKLKPNMSRGEFWAVLILVTISAGALGAVIGICFAIRDYMATYSAIYSTMPVFMLFINGYISYVESWVAAHKAVQTGE